MYFLLFFDVSIFNDVVRFKTHSVVMSFCPFSYKHVNSSFYHCDMMCVHPNSLSKSILFYCSFRSTYFKRVFRIIDENLVSSILLFIFIDNHNAYIFYNPIMSLYQS